MYDTLTRADLADLHAKLYHEQQLYFWAMYGHDYEPVIEVGGPTWNVLRDKMNEVHDLMTEVYAEIKIRDAVERVIVRGSDPVAIAEAEGDFGPGGIFEV